MVTGGRSDVNSVAPTGLTGEVDSVVTDGHRPTGKVM